MAFRADILAGQAVIKVSIQDDIDRSFRTMKSKLFAFSNSFQRIGQDLFAFGSLGTIGAIFPVKEFANFQDTLLFIQSKLKGTGADINELEKYIRNLGRTTSFTAKEVGEAAAVLAQAGLGRNVQALLLPSLDLARASRIDIETAARILTNATVAFGLGFENANETASKIITATRLGTTDTILLGESLKELATTFKQLNIPFDVTLSLISSLSNVSLRGTKAGTSLNAAFANLAKKIPQLRELGVVVDSALLEKDPVKFFDDIKEQLDKLTATDQVAKLQDLFNIRGGRAIGGVIIQDLQKLKDILKEVSASTDEARESAILMDSRLGGSFRIALSAFQELGLSIGATTEGPLVKFNKYLIDAFNSLSTLATTFPRVTQGLLLLPVVSLAAGVGLIGLSVIASRIPLLLAPVNAAIQILIISLKKLASAPVQALTPIYRAVISQPIARIVANYTRQEAAIRKAQTSLAKQLAKPVSAVKLNRSQNRLKSLVAATKQDTKAIEKARTLYFKELDKFQRGGKNAGNITKSRTALDTALAARSQFNPKRLLAGFRAIQLDVGFLFRPINLATPSFIKKAVTTSFQEVTPAIASTIITELSKLPTLVNRQSGKLTPILGRGAATQKLFNFGPDQLGLFDEVQKEIRRSDVGPALAKFNAKAEKEIADAVQKLLGNKNARKELQRSGNVESALRRRLSRIDLPDQLIPRVLHDAVSKVPRNAVKIPKTFIQQTFDFSDALEPKLNLRPALQLNLPEVVSVGEKIGETLGSGYRKAAKKRGTFSIVKAIFAEGSARTLGTFTKFFTSSFGSIFRVLRKIEWTSIFVRSLNTLGKSLKTVYTLLRTLATGFRGLFRFVFSLNGILTILEFIAIAGPKIAPIKAILDGIGAAFGAAFNTMKQAVVDIKPLLDNLFAGLNKFAFSDPIQGLADIKAAASGIVDVLSAGFALAWERFKVEAERGIQFVKVLFAGLLGIASSIGEVFEGIVTVAFGSRPQPGDGSEEFSFGDGPLNFLNGLFETLFGVIQTVGHLLITAFYYLRTAFNVLKDIVIDIYRLLANSWFGDDRSKKNSARLDPAGENVAKQKFNIEKLIESKKNEILNLYRARSFELISADTYEQGSKGLESDLAQLEHALQVLGGSDKIDYLAKALTTFDDKLGKIFANYRKSLDKIDINTTAALTEYNKSIFDATVSVDRTRPGLSSSVDAVNTYLNASTDEYLQNLRAQIADYKVKLNSTSDQGFKNLYKSILNELYKSVEKVTKLPPVNTDTADLDLQAKRLEEKRKYIRTLRSEIAGENNKPDIEPDFERIATLEGTIALTLSQIAEAEKTYAIARAKYNSTASLPVAQQANQARLQEELARQKSYLGISSTKDDQLIEGYNRLRNYFSAYLDPDQSIRDDLDTALTAMNKFLDPINDLYRAERDKIAGVVANDLKDAGLSSIAKTVSGYANSVSGQKLQIIPSKVEEKVLEATEEIVKNTTKGTEFLAKLSSNAQPLVFQA